jgi:hypothetical protein
VLDRLRRLRHPWLLMLVLIIGALLAIETTRIFSTQFAVARAAREAARFAVTGVYGKKYCVPPYNLPCNDSDRSKRKEAEDQARLYTIKEIALDAVGSVLSDPINNLKNKPNSSRVTVCSTRKGFSYDGTAGQCIPHDDAGDSLDKVIVRVDYNYPLGSFFGLNLGAVPLRATQQMIVERAGPIRIPGLPPTFSPTHQVEPNK